MEDLMKNRFAFLSVWIVISVLVLTAGCASTPDSRIEEKRTLFDTYSEDVKSNLRLGKVAVGYDPEMVRIALGEPDETSTEISEAGETLMWGYTRSRPGFSVGLGGGSFGGSSGVGMGVGMGSGPRRNYTAIIEFRKDRVTRARYFDN
jgi:hypothetical protein